MNPIQDAYDRGDYAAGATLNVATGIARGGTRESGGAIRREGHMSADISPHTYRPIPTTPQHCRVCLGTVRSDFCREPAGMRAPSPADLARGYSLGSPFDLAGRVRPEMRNGK